MMLNMVTHRISIQAFFLSTLSFGSLDFQGQRLYAMENAIVCFQIAINFSQNDFVAEQEFRRLVGYRLLYIGL